MRMPARTPTTQLVLVAAIFFFALGASAATALDADLEIDGLFSESSVPGTLDITDAPTVMRYRYVDVDFDDLHRRRWGAKEHRTGPHPALEPVR